MPNMINTDINVQVKEALERTEIMALSTVGSDGSWTSPVKYHYDDKLNFFFYSMMDTKHVANILEDPRVSAAIFTHPGPPGGNIGLQIKGKAKEIDEKSDATSEGWHCFKITTEEVWVFDSRVYGKIRKKVDLTTLQIK
jgi:general stress protein 26